MAEENEKHTRHLLVVHETHRTIRWVTTCAVIAFGLWLCMPVVEKVLVKPPWLTLSLALVVALAAPSSVMKAMFGLLHRNIKRLSARSRSYEQKDDPNRTSSDLEPDGSSRHGH